MATGAKKASAVQWAEEELVKVQQWEEQKKDQDKERKEEEE